MYFLIIFRLTQLIVEVPKEFSGDSLSEQGSAQTNIALIHAKSLFALKQYDACASFLAPFISKKKDPIGVFLFYYAKLMAIQKRSMETSSSITENLVPSDPAIPF